MSPGIAEASARSALRMSDLRAADRERLERDPSARPAQLALATDASGGARAPS